MLQSTDTFDSEENYTATKQKAQICLDKQLRAACSQPEFSFCTSLTQYPASTALKKKETKWSNSDARRQFYFVHYLLWIKGFLNRSTTYGSGYCHFGTFHLCSNYINWRISAWIQLLHLANFFNFLHLWRQYHFFQATKQAHPFKKQEQLT